MAKPPKPVIERLLDRIEIAENECWIYPCVNENGYGVIGLGGRGGKTARTHRVAYEHLRGDIPEGMQLDHLCRTRACCNPSHLQPVTQQENVRRGLRKRHINHCVNGHEFTPENTRRTLRQRVCLTCERARTAAYYRRKKDAA